MGGTKQFNSELDTAQECLDYIRREFDKSQYEYNVKGICTAVETIIEQLNQMKGNL